MKKQIESINTSVLFPVNYRTYESDEPSKYPDLRVECPGYGQQQCNCNLTALINFMQKTAFGVEQMRAARRRGCSEGDVWFAFKEYCQAIKEVDYQYTDEGSLFDRTVNFGKPNCRGRAKGFVQLVAVCGVPLKDLVLVRLGGSAEDDGKKIVGRDEATVNPHNVRVLANAPEALNSSNAVTVSLENNVLKVSRTTREPFAYHYCAMVGMRGRCKFYDPLFHRVYVNGMNDYFLTYAERPDLIRKPNSPKCYVDADDTKNRMYLFKPDQVVSETFANSQAVKEVQSETLAKDKSVYLIIDSKNWLDRGLLLAARGSRRGEMNPNQHPWIATQIFGELFPYD